MSTAEADARARDVVAMRTLGLSVACIAGVLDGYPSQLEGALSSHQFALGDRMRQLSEAPAKVRVRIELASAIAWLLDDENSRTLCSAWMVRLLARLDRFRSTQETGRVSCSKAFVWIDFSQSPRSEVRGADFKISASALTQ